MKADIKKIIEFRKTKNITVKRLAELLDVSTRTIYNWEKSVSKPGKTDLLAIAHLLKVKLSDISTYKDYSFHYSKPALCKTDNIKEGTEHLKKIINNINHCEDYTKLIPLLHAEEEISGLVFENNRLLERISKVKLYLDLINTAIYVKNFKRVVTYVNQGFINILPEKMNEYDVIGHKFLEIFSLKEYDQIRKIKNKAFEGLPVNNEPMILPDKFSLRKCFISIKPTVIKNNKIQEIIATVRPL